jgi:hypothetical protein
MEGFDSSSENRETLVTATKGTSDWWGDGPLDLLLKVKEADSIIGHLPASSPATAICTVLARQYSKLYSHFIATGLNTAGGNTVVPLSTSDDLDNTTGHRNLVWDNGDAATTLVDEELLYNVGSSGAGNMDAGVRDDGGTFQDDTTDLNSIAATDVNVYNDPAVVEDAFYFGKDNIFTFMMVDVATAHNGTTSTQVWEYWDGSAWSALTVVDDTDAANGAFDTTGRGLISWTAPTDWARTNVTNQPAAAPTNLYYIRIRISVLGDLTTEPVLSTAWVGGETQLKGRVADTAIVTPGGATGNADYYLLGDPITDFANDDVVVAPSSRKTFDVNGAPTNVGPALDTTVTIVFGQTTEDINNGNGARPYSIRVDPATLSMERVYERLKFVTRRGSTEAMTIGNHTQDGEEYVGSELQVEYTGQAGGNFVQGQMVFDQTAKGVGVIVGDHDDGATGDVILRVVRGTFTAGNVLSDTTAATLTLAACLGDDSGAFTDETADAISAAGADVAVPQNSTGDALYVGADDVFGILNIDIATAATGSPTVAWEYWNGSSWTAVTGLTDNTTAFSAGTGFLTVEFDVPSNWVARTVGAGTTGTQIRGPHYYVRARTTATATADAVVDEIQILDHITATIGSTRTISPESRSPFGTKAGDIVFFGPGVAITSGNVAAGDEQDYRLTDDDGTLQTPPNTVAVSVTNLVSGDSVAVYRIDVGGDIIKNQYTSDGTNNQSDVDIVVNEAITSDTPTSGKIRMVSVSNDEHRYRYSSFTSSTFTLDTGVVGGTSDGGSSSVTRLHDTTGTPFTNAEVGDYIRNITQGLIVRITNVVDANNVDTDELPLSWGTAGGDSYDYNVLMETYTSGDNTYVPFIERIADAATESQQLIYTSDIDIRVVVRRSISGSNPILPFSQDDTIGSTGRSVATVRTNDDILA